MQPAASASTGPANTNINLRMVLRQKTRRLRRSSLAGLRLASREFLRLLDVLRLQSADDRLPLRLRGRDTAVLRHHVPGVGPVRVRRRAASFFEHFGDAQRRLGMPALQTRCSRRRRPRRPSADSTPLSCAVPPAFGVLRRRAPSRPEPRQFCGRFFARDPGLCYRPSACLRRSVSACFAAASCCRGPRCRLFLAAFFSAALAASAIRAAV